MWTILIGALAGFLAGHVLRGRGYGAIGNIVLGIFGGIVGGFALWVMGFHTHGLIGDLIAGTIGAIALVYFFGNRRQGGRAEE